VWERQDAKQATRPDERNQKACGTKVASGGRVHLVIDGDETSRARRFYLQPGGMRRSRTRGKTDAACSRSTAFFMRHLRENTDDKIGIEDFFLFPAPDARFFYRPPSI
jgi:hypothetical protein